MTRLVILSLLQMKPMHGYEMRQFIKAQRMEQWTDIGSGSIYFALSQMEKEGLVNAGAEERTGDRLRRIYSITSKGSSALNDLLRDALANPPHSLKSSFSFAIVPSFLLKQEERIRIYEQNIAKLKEMKKAWEIGQNIKAEWHPAIKLIFQHDLELIKSDIRLLEELIKITDEPNAALIFANSAKKPTPSPRKRTKPK
jgi:DNA-binding PadR family transcriptional regulator